MEAFVANTLRSRLSLPILGCLAFMVVGLWWTGLLVETPTSSRYPPWVFIEAGWLDLIVIVPLTVLLAKRWWENSEQLRIGDQGIKYSAWSDKLIPWAEIEDVTVWRYPHREIPIDDRFIVLHLRNPSRFPGQGVRGFLARTRPGLTGGDVSISLAGTDRSFDEAMSAIKRFRLDTSDPHPQ